MTTPETGSPGPVLQEAARELEAAVHDAQVAFGCIVYRSNTRLSG